MVSAISKGVKIKVEVFFEKEYSNVAQQEYLYAYRITIENQNSFPIQLMRRRWVIFDSNGITKEVEGAGVVGEQPVIQPSEAYTYTSACNLQTEMGKMQGNYYMLNLYNKTLFEVTIPSFVLMYPYKNN